MTADFARNLDHALSGLPPDGTAGNVTSLNGITLLGNVLRSRVKRLFRRMRERSSSETD
jgi:hypothetical protein